MASRGNKDTENTGIREDDLRQKNRGKRGGMKETGLEGGT